MMNRFTKENFRTMLWKNGGGVTTELLRISENNDDFLFRISIAQVNSNGPFSIFPGIDRHLLILEGNGCILNNHLRLTKESPVYFFQGEENIICHLIDGEIRDFNVMIKRGWRNARVEKGFFSTYTGKEITYIFLTKSFELIEIENESISFPEQECIIVSVI
jgi:environmental stress-induced protein Ves